MKQSSCFHLKRAAYDEVNDRKTKKKIYNARRNGVTFLFVFSDIGKPGKATGKSIEMNPVDNKLHPQMFCLFQKLFFC